MKFINHLNTTNRSYNVLRGAPNDFSKLSLDKSFWIWTWFFWSYHISDNCALFFFKIGHHFISFNENYFRL